MLDCDTLLMLGTDFPYRQFYPINAKVAQIDLRPENLGRRTRLDLGLVWDVGATIEALLPQPRTREDRGPGPPRSPPPRRSAALLEEQRVALGALDAGERHSLGRIDERASEGQRLFLQQRAEIHRRERRAG
jgi:thiamine pyrophosphate-dependent acetolactate synthase large subunit-like protein